MNYLLPIQGEGLTIFTLFGSEPNLNDGQELCGRCKGTGVEMMSRTQLLFNQEGQ